MKTSTTLVQSNESQVVKDSSDEIENNRPDGSFESLLKKKSLHSMRFLKFTGLFDKLLKEVGKEECPSRDAIKLEEDFIKKPTIESFFNVEKEFKSTMLILGHHKFDWNKDLSVLSLRDATDLDVPMPYVTKKSAALEKWHDKKGSVFVAAERKTTEKTALRHRKISEKGPGYGGKMTQVIGKSKAAAFYGKNHFTIRGNMFELVNKICPMNIYEIMPRYGYRKDAHIGVRVGQFTINALIVALGYGLIPVTFGASKIISQHLNTLITLSGEVITRKIAGADKKKLQTHAALRGIQMEIPLFIPIAGQVIYYAEWAAFSAAAFGIVSTTIADGIMSHVSTRYKSTINIDDLGDSRCLTELNKRIDYLSQFLLPYGQYLLFKESDIASRDKLREILKAQFKTLRGLERKKIESLNFYRLALAAETIPCPYLEVVQKDCEMDVPEKYINTHRTVKVCLAALIAHDPELTKIYREKDAYVNKLMQHQQSGSQSAKALSLHSLFSMTRLAKKITKGVSSQFMAK